MTRNKECEIKDQQYKAQWYKLLQGKEEMSSQLDGTKLWKETDSQL